MHFKTFIAAAAALAMTTLGLRAEETGALITAFQSDGTTSTFEWGDYSKLVGLKMLTSTDLQNWEECDVAHRDFSLLALNCKGIQDLTRVNDVPKRFFRLVAIRDESLPDNPYDVIVIPGEDNNHYIKIGTHGGKTVYIKTGPGGVIEMPPTFWTDIDDDPPTQVFPGEGMCYCDYCDCVGGGLVVETIILPGGGGTTYGVVVYTNAGETV